MQKVGTAQRDRSMAFDLTRALLALGVAICLTLALGPDSAPAAFPGANGKIAFTSDRHGNRGEIYVMNADGSAQTRLTTTLTSTSSPPSPPTAPRSRSPDPSPACSRST
jgi:hypothetical protein